MTATMLKAKFDGSSGETLAARIDLPAGKVRGYALFAHCFTCSKDIAAARHVASALARVGIGVLRFDFTGLGASGGDFGNTNFSSNVADLRAAAQHLRENFGAPTILIGHSLGGAAVLAAAGHIPDAKAVVTIGAPADVEHVLHNFSCSLDQVRDAGEAEVMLGGRPFTIKRQFIEDAQQQKLETQIANLRKALLVMHAPTDNQVGIENAAAIFAAAKHPKSFVSLDGADHLLSNSRDAAYAAQVISAWASRFLPQDDAADQAAGDDVLVAETGYGKFQNTVQSGRHRLLADEPKEVGGLDSGPSPYDYLSIALGACTSMTLRLYAQHKKLELGRISVQVNHGKVATQHCEDCGQAAEGRGGKIDRFERVISVDGEIAPELKEKLVEIADKCPVHKTLEGEAAVVTKVEDA